MAREPPTTTASTPSLAINSSASFSTAAGARCDSAGTGGGTAEFASAGQTLLPQMSDTKAERGPDTDPIRV